MAFHDIRLPEDIERGAFGGPSFNTSIQTLSSAYESRNENWSKIRASWNIGYGVNDKATFDALLAFFINRRGRAHSFRFKDWSDYSLARQSIGSTDGSTATYQIFKRYTSGSQIYDRDIIKPVASGGLVWVNNVSQTVVYDTTPAATEVAINSLTGVATLGATHAATSGQAIEVQLEFDVPVRFDIDQFPLNVLWAVGSSGAGSVTEIPIIEVRGE